MKTKLPTKKLTIRFVTGGKAEILDYDHADLVKGVWKIYKDGKLFVEYALKDVKDVSPSYVK